MGSSACASITMARARFIASLSICQRDSRESWKKSWLSEASAILLRPRLSPSARRTFRSPTLSLHGAPVRRCVPRTETGPDGARLGGRFDDDDVHGACPPDARRARIAPGRTRGTPPARRSASRGSAAPACWTEPTNRLGTGRKMPVGFISMPSGHVIAPSAGGAANGPAGVRGDGARRPAGGAALSGSASRAQGFRLPAPVRRMHGTRGGFRGAYRAELSEKPP